MFLYEKFVAATLIFLKLLQGGSLYRGDKCGEGGIFPSTELSLDWPCEKLADCSGGMAKNCATPKSDWESMVPFRSLIGIRVASLIGKIHSPGRCRWIFLLQFNGSDPKVLLRLPINPAKIP